MINYKPIKMKYHHYYLLLIFLGCTQKEDCFTIREKATQNGYYYFLDRTDYLEDRDDITGQIRVSLATYNDYMIGDQFCVD